MTAKAKVIKVIKKKHILFGTVRFYNGYAFLQDIAHALNYRDNNEYYDLIESYDFFEGKYHLINDEGIKTLIANSNTKVPMVFSQWIFSFCLPSIRKTDNPIIINNNKTTTDDTNINKQLNDSFMKHVQSIKDWITIPIHGFSNNYMYSYSKDGNIVKSKAYFKWRKNFPVEYLNKLSHIDFNKPIQAYYIFDQKEEFDTPNFNKSITDTIVDYFNVDDHNIVNEICIRGKIVNTYDEGKIHIFLYNIN